MGSEIVYCNTCGDRLLESDFRKGKAQVIATRNYCWRCVPQHLRKSKEETKQKVRTTRVPKLEKRASKAPLYVGIGIAVLVFVIILIMRALQ